jgi:hypothetical protein
MANPMTGWIPLTDQFGTQVASLEVKVNYSLMKPFMAVPGQLTELVMMPVGMLSTFALWLMTLMQDQSWFTETLGGAYQAVIDQVYRVVNPWWIAGIAIPVLIFRLFVGEPQRESVDKKQIQKNSKTRITFKQNTSTMAGDEVFRKKVITQLGQTAGIVAVIGILLANPFALIARLFGIIESFSQAATQQWGGGTGGSITGTVVDGMYVPALQIVNFGTVLDAECSELWSRTLASGGDVLQLECIPGGEDAANASWPMFGTALGLGIAMCCLVFFIGATFLKLSFFEAKMLMYVAILPWRLAWMIANPGPDRQRLDEGWRNFKDALVACGWACGLLAILLLVPGIGTSIANQIGNAVESDYILIPAFLVLAAVYAGAGYAIWKFYGHPLQWDKEKKRLVVGQSEGLTSWGEWYTEKIKPSVPASEEAPGGDDAKDAADKAAKEEAAADKASAASGDATPEDAASAIVDDASDGYDPSTSRTVAPSIPLLVQPPRSAPVEPDEPGAAPIPAAPGSPILMPGGGGAAAIVGGGAAAAAGAAIGAGLGSGGPQPPVARPIPPGAPMPVLAAPGAPAPEPPVVPPVVMFSTAEQLTNYLSTTQNTTNVHPGAPPEAGAVMYDPVSGLEILEGEVVDAPRVGRHTAAAAVMPVIAAAPVDPVEAYRQQINSLRENIAASSPLGGGGDGSSTDATVSGAGAAATVPADRRIDAIATAALKRTQDAFTDAATATAQAQVPGGGAATQRPFFGPESMRNRWAEVVRLAAIEGIAVDAVVIDDEQSQIWVRFESGLDGQPRVAFGNPAGFGDDIY